MGQEAVEGCLTSSVGFSNDGDGGGAGEMREGGRRGGVRVAGCLGAFYRADGRRRGGWPMKGRRRCSGAPL
jgi:hypothetical protein